MNTLTYLDEVNEVLDELDIPMLTAHIKMERPKYFSVLISVPLDDFIDPKLLTVYEKTQAIERNSQSDNYRVTFSFTHNEGTLDEDCLKAEGFVKIGA